MLTNIVNRIVIKLMNLKLYSTILQLLIAQFFLEIFSFDNQMRPVLFITNLKINRWRWILWFYSYNTGFYFWRWSEVVFPNLQCRFKLLNLGINAAFITLHKPYHYG